MGWRDARAWKRINTSSLSCCVCQVMAAVPIELSPHDRIGLEGMARVSGRDPADLVQRRQSTTAETATRHGEETARAGSRAGGRAKSALVF